MEGGRPDESDTDVDEALSRSTVRAAPLDPDAATDLDDSLDPLGGEPEDALDADEPEDEAWEDAHEDDARRSERRLATSSTRCRLSTS